MLQADATEHGGQEPELGALDALSNAPSSGRLLSGQSSYAHVSHPSRPGSAQSNEHEDDRSSHTSEWGSDNEVGHPVSSQLYSPSLLAVHIIAKAGCNNWLATCTNILEGSALARLLI